MNTLLGLFGQRRRLPVVQQIADDDVYPIHLQDFNLRKLIMACTLRFDQVLDADELHAGLARLLEMGDWRKLAGRLRRNVSKRY